MIYVNGEETQLQAGAPLAQALALLGIKTSTRGVAVAIDGEVLPRERWEQITLEDGARVEVLAAIQGG
jgi:sulfur carrier protein